MLYMKSEYENRLKELIEKDKNIDKRINQTTRKIDRNIEILNNTKYILDDLDDQFEKQTGLDKTDVSILFIAIGLQVIRQFYFTSSMKRMSDREAAEKTKGHHQGHSDRHHNLYNPSLEQIRKNPVSFDLNHNAQGKLEGAGKLGHRGKTLGHDPLLGLIFGTANIATSTVTLTDFSSYHVKTDIHHCDYFYRKANTLRVLEETKKKMMDVKDDGVKKVCLSMYYEIVHLQSDLKTKNSLPLPVLTSFNPQLASSLAKHGIDMFNVVKYGRYVVSAEAAMVINQMIAIFHGLFFKGQTDMEYKLYSVKTKKIINYSNIIASTTNLVKAYISQDLSQVDLGGIAVCVYQVINNKKFIQQVKNEFIFGKYKDIFLYDNDYVIES